MLLRFVKIVGGAKRGRLLYVPEMCAESTAGRFGSPSLQRTPVYVGF